MDTRDVAQSLTCTLKKVCPGIELDYSMSLVEYTLHCELVNMMEQSNGKDENQSELFTE